jgi:ribosomal protein L21
MYAVVETGGKQYRVAVGEQLRVEKLPGMAGEVIEHQGKIVGQWIAKFLKLHTRK